MDEPSEVYKLNVLKKGRVSHFCTHLDNFKQFFDFKHNYITFLFILPL